MKDIYDILREWKKRRSESLGRTGTFALATLVRAEGSSYRRPGARMLICPDGTIVGSLSAGCLEDEVAARARNVLQTRKAELISFDTRRRFGCSGKIDIYVECIEDGFFAALTNDLEARREHVAVTRFGNKEFVQKIHPPLRTFVIGDGPDNAPLVSAGSLLGWKMPQVADANSLSIRPDEWTAAIIKTHNYGRDFVALQKFLPLNLPYVGLVGPRKRRDQLMNALLDLGITINAGFFAPAGLDIGGETPEEIALSIISEIQCVFARRSGDSLRERKSAIHRAEKSPPNVGSLAQQTRLL